jgi:hypothetical protein
MESGIASLVFDPGELHAIIHVFQDGPGSLNIGCNLLSRAIGHEHLGADDFKPIYIYSSNLVVVFLKVDLQSVPLVEVSRSPISQFLPNLFAVHLSLLSFYHS